MATHSLTTPADAGQSLSPGSAILPVEDAFCDMLDAFERAIAEEEALDHRYYGDPAYRLFFASADACWLRLHARADLVTCLEPLGPTCALLQDIARSIIAVVHDEEAKAIAAVMTGTLRRTRLDPLNPATVEDRRAEMLMAQALRLLEHQVEDEGSAAGASGAPVPVAEPVSAA
ncbi:hypothetical protein [Pseudoroseicyclus aestuarii]|uniref:Uncharacterized protein n=1 Tax=Pseudoroseicyclus aestuarii TaxID=1795041 RepID=A0A318SMD6_9RHOB|nr:hypothetical protein [Pseudoroseicyclus aestuarii]PYE80866.1 hypothetical protein DFP88_11030 [Pseudoroseicyclus aestuarii]